MIMMQLAFFEVTDMNVVFLYVFVKYDNDSS